MTKLYVFMMYKKEKYFNGSIKMILCQSLPMSREFPCFLAFNYLTVAVNDGFQTRFVGQIVWKIVTPSL